jgi:hypothetical protein
MEVPILIFAAREEARGVTTEVITTQRGLPPHMRTPQARAGWGTALDRAAAYIASIAAKERS